MYAVVAVIELEPQIRDEFVALALQSVEGAHHEPGCQRFDVVQSVDHPNRIGFYEVYRDRAALDAHRTQPYFQAWWNATSRWQTEDLVRLTAIGGQHLRSADPDYT